MTTTKMTTTKWALDNTHSEVQFKVRHLMISTVTGQFNKFQATVETEEEDDFTTAKVSFSADINSISTNNDQRDAHLKSADFFDVTNYPQLRFEAERIEKVDDENYKVYGIITIKGVSKKIVLNAEFGGVIQDPWGNSRTGFSLTGKLNRSDFGLSFGLVSDAGGVGLANEVKLLANVQLVKQIEELA
jgi:polyisoprenoid-binding protein YceI